MPLLNINILNCRGLGDWHKRQFLTELFISQTLIYAFYKKLTVLLNLSGIHGKGHGEGNGPSVVRVQEGWAFGFGMG